MFSIWVEAESPPKVMLLMADLPLVPPVKRDRLAVAEPADAQHIHPLIAKDAHQPLLQPLHR